MASSVSVCKVGLHWDSPKAPRIYSQPKLVGRGQQDAKRSARSFNQSFDLSNSSVRLSTSTHSTHKTLRVLDENMSTRLEGRSSTILSKLKYH